MSPNIESLTYESKSYHVVWKPEVYTLITMIPESCDGHRGVKGLIQVCDALNEGCVAIKESLTTVYLRGMQKKKRGGKKKQVLS